MQLKNGLGSLAIVASLFAGVGAGCTGTVRVAEPVAVVEVDEEPPPPRAEVVEVRPGFVFVQGNWFRANGRWEWRGGRWERERVGYVWEGGHWDRRGNRHVWVEGRWRGR